MIFQECTLTRFSFEKQKSGRRVARFFPFEILRGACNQRGKVLDFDDGVVTRRHSFGFSRRAHFTIGKNPMGAKRQKGKISNFSFLAFLGLRGRTPYATSVFE